MSGLPSFLIKRTPKKMNMDKIKTLIQDDSLHTVCQSAFCPNIGECFSKNTLTFMILGNICTRNCAFCGIEKGDPLPVDKTEPERIKKAVEKLGLKYVVITSVTRDDLLDYGAGHFAEVIKTLRPIPVEVLIPDFKGDEKSLKEVIEAKPIVINHNVETVPRLYPKIRNRADYAQSLGVLSKVKELSPSIYTKSGFMVGLGETDEEILSVLRDLNRVGCDIVTIGQYLPPSKSHPEVSRYVDLESFSKYKDFGEGLGIKKVFAGPFVRSSYKAGEILCFQNKPKDY